MQLHSRSATARAQPCRFAKQYVAGKSNSEEPPIANVKIRWQWIGVGIAPQKVWVRKEATATATVSPAGSMTVSNGLGSPSTLVEESPQKIKTCSGNKLEEISLNGNYLEVPFSMEATAESNNPTPTHFNMCSTNLAYSISLKGVLLGPGTSRKGPGGAVVPNLLVDKRADVVGTLFPNFQVDGGRFDLGVSSNKFGNWVDPFHTWTYWWYGGSGFGHGTVYDNIFQELTSVQMTAPFSYSQAKSMVQGSGTPVAVVHKLKDTASTEDHTEQTVDLQVYPHAPIENPVWYSSSPEWPWQVKVTGGFSSPINTNGSGTIEGEYEKLASQWFGILGTGAELYAVYSLNPWTVGIGVALQLVGLMIPQPESWNVVFNDAFDSMNPESFFIGGKTDLNKAHWEMTHGVHQNRTTTKVSRGEKYGSGGYEGYAFESFIVETSAGESGIFRLKGGGGPGGGGWGTPPPPGN